MPPILPSNSNSESNSAPAPAPEIVTTPDQLDPTEVIDGIARLFDTRASELFMIISQDKKSHVKAPGLSRPWVTRNRVHADQVAREVGGLVITVDEGIKLMMHQIIKKQTN